MHEEAKAQPRPRTWHVLYFYVSSNIEMHKNKKFALSVFKKQTPTVRVCINAAVNALRCVLEKENLFVRFLFIVFFFTLTSLNWQHHQEERHFLWTFFPPSRHCYLPLRTESNQKSRILIYYSETEYTVDLHSHKKGDTLILRIEFWSLFSQQISLLFWFVSALWATLIKSQRPQLTVTLPVFFTLGKLNRIISIKIQGLTYPLAARL